MRQFCRIGQRRIDVVNAERGIAGQDLILGGALGKTVKYHCDRNPHARCTELTAADMWATVEELLPRRHMFSLLGTPLGDGRDSLTAHNPEFRNGGRYPASSEQGTISALPRGHRTGAKLVP